MLVEGGNQGEIDTAFDLKRLFPPVHGKKGGFADWFTGMLLVQEGKHRVDLEGGRYTDEFKRYRILSIKEGVFIQNVALDSDSYWAAVKEIQAEVPRDSLSANGVLLRAYHDDQVDAGMRTRRDGDEQPALGPGSEQEGGGQPQPEVEGRTR